MTRPELFIITSKNETDLIVKVNESMKDGSKIVSVTIEKPIQPHEVMWYTAWMVRMVNVK